MKKFNKKIQAQFSKMCATGKLFRVDLSGVQVWDLYLKSFEDDPTFRDPNSFKQATREKLRFNFKGSLSVEQLWDLSLNDLDTLAVSLQKSYEESKGKSFLEKRTTKDKGLKLQFDIVLEVLQDKVAESAALKEAAEKELYNDKIIDAIAKAEDNELAGKSVKELKGMILK